MGANLEADVERTLRVRLMWPPQMQRSGAAGAKEVESQKVSNGLNKKCPGDGNGNGKEKLM